jgi:hypothetical protein
MIRINLSSVRKDSPTHAVWTDPVLTVDGNDFDLSLLPDGATADHIQLGLVSRVGNDYECTVVMAHGKNASEETRFPESLIITQNGQIVLPC